MAWTNPTTQSTGTLITATIWNTDIVDNLTALRGGSLAITSQAAGDVIYASSSTQLGRVAIGTSGYVLTSNGSAPAWSNTPTLTGTNFTGIPAAGVTGTAAVLNAANSFTAGIGVGAGQTLALNNAGGNTYFTEVSSVALDAYADGYQMYRMYPTSGGHIWYGTAGATQMQLTMAGLLTVSGFGTHSFSAGGTGANILGVRNTSAGTANYTRLIVGNDTSESLASITAFASNYTSFNNVVRLTGEGAGGLEIYAEHASGDLRFYNRGGTLALTLGASQAASFTGDLSLASTKKLYLDGGGDSYIAETAANVVRIYAGGQDVVVAKSDGLYIGLVPTTASAANMYFNTSTARVEYSTSSLRYKHDIDTLDADHALSAVMAMRPVTYRGKTDDDQRRYVGFIAEEVMEIAPLLATYDEGGESGTPNYVTYDRVTAYLVAVVQKQQAEIDALKARIQ